MNYILLFGMPGGGELFFIVLVIIMLFGSKKIPELARGLGKGIREIKNATGDIQREIREGAREMNAAKDKIDVEKQVKEMIKNETEFEKTDSVKEEKTKEAQTPASETIYRRNPYTKEEPQNPTENS
ncbi:MAG: twin-arginine translocase TatA/TatE family subunit [Flavobacteriales bacterium]|nr:MAG: twin-arginine translocase TatA/TatE family subunit [Flavobacteriales bacterium]